MSKLVGIYLPVDVVNTDPGYLDALQEKLGLTHVLVSGQRVRLSPATLALNPYLAASTPLDAARSLVCRGFDGEIPGNLGEARVERVGQGPTFASGDDTDLRQAIETIKSRGLTAWFVGGAWTANSLMFCPSKEPINAWLEAVYADIARNYDVEAIDVTHARYPKFAFVETLFQCACPDCVRSAAELGYDLPRIVGRIQASVERLGKVSARDVAGAARSELGFPDLLQILPEAEDLVDWLNFRCDLIARNLGRIRQAVKTANPAVQFGSDTYPPALAALVGHRYRAWPSHSDFYSPLLSHIFAFLTQGFANWTRFLQGKIADLSERDALNLLYQVTGYGGLGMPESIEALALDSPDGEFRHVPIGGLMRRDLEKSRLYASSAIPSYPIIQGGVWPTDVIRDLIATAERVGHDGIIFQGSGSLLTYPGRD